MIAAISIDTILLLVVFVVAYCAIIFESITKINKAAAALFGGALCWLVIFLEGSAEEHVLSLSHHLSGVSQIIFFLMGAMTIVELIDSHHGFQVIVHRLRTDSKVLMLWIIGVVSFFVSAVLDNLTATIVMLSLLRRILPERSERWFYGSIVVIAANAGGAWTPIGDVTTTMLWIHGNLSTLSVMKELFLPSIASLLVTLAIGSWFFRGKKLNASYVGRAHARQEPGAQLTFMLGIGSLILVPIIKGLTGLPPFMSMFIGVAILWIATDLWHSGHHDRDHLKIPHALTRIDTSGVLFFIGILLAVGALDSAGLLKALAEWLSEQVASIEIIAILIGIGSAIVDNVPLVAATLSMYSLDAFPMDAPFWNLIAYCAGTGGSILIIGSAAGVALMSLEKVDFFWYLRRVTPLALLSYFTGIGVYLLIQWIMASPFS